MARFSLELDLQKMSEACLMSYDLYLAKCPTFKHDIIDESLFHFGGISGKCPKFFNLNFPTY